MKGENLERCNIATTNGDGFVAQQTYNLDRNLTAASIALKNAVVS